MVVFVDVSNIEDLFLDGTSEDLLSSELKFVVVQSRESEDDVIRVGRPGETYLEIMKALREYPSDGMSSSLRMVNYGLAKVIKEPVPGNEGCYVDFKFLGRPTMHLRDGMEVQGPQSTIFYLKAVH